MEQQFLRCLSVFMFVHCSLVRLFVGSYVSISYSLDQKQSNFTLCTSYPNLQKFVFLYTRIAYSSMQKLFSKPFSKQQILDSSKLKKTADNNFNRDENDWKFSEREENIVGKGEIACSHSVFKRLALQPRKNRGLFGKGLQGKKID